VAPFVTTFETLKMNSVQVKDWENRPRTSLRWWYCDWKNQYDEYCIDDEEGVSETVEKLARAFTPSLSACCCGCGGGGDDSSQSILTFSIAIVKSQRLYSYLFSSPFKAVQRKQQYFYQFNRL